MAHFCPFGNSFIQFQFLHSSLLEELRRNSTEVAPFALKLETVNHFRFPKMRCSGLDPMLEAHHVMTRGVGLDRLALLFF